MPVQLLVSVRSPQEALAALEGGADIIDVKEPSRGSLGAASLSAIIQITQLVRQARPETWVSAAMGEVADANDPAGNETSHEFLGQLNYLKCGLSGLRGQDDSVTWKQAWAGVRQRYHSSDITTPWVAVSYADWERSRSPTPLEVLAEGARFSAPVLLVDTFQKDNSNLLDWLDDTQLRQLRDATHDVGMKLALAGRITIESIPDICRHSPDIVAIRGAACDQGRRSGTVTAERVRTFRARLTRLAQYPLENC